MADKMIQNDAYTLLAEAKLRHVEENQMLQTAIHKGHQNIVDEILKYSLEHPMTWGDYLKRLVFDMTAKEDDKFDDFTEEQLKERIKASFVKNGMSNRGSMNPTTKSTLSGSLDKWMAKPVTAISRQTAFLFAFGLGLDDEQTEDLLTYVLRSSNYNVRDYKEAIYLYCLKRGLSYTDVKEWLALYDEIEVTDSKKPDVGTIILKRDMLESVEKSGKIGFLEYLKNLKRMNISTKHSLTNATILKNLLSEVYYSLSEERCVQMDMNETERLIVQKRTVGTSSQYRSKHKTLGRLQRSAASVDYKELQKEMLSVPTEDIVISQVYKEMINKKLLMVPSFSEGSLEKKISERTTDVSREDIIMATFLLCACGMGDENVEEEYNLAARKAEFVYEANLNLLNCGFSEVYLLNPFELFIVSCLLQKEPLRYFIAAWKYALLIQK